MEKEYEEWKYFYECMCEAGLKESTPEEVEKWEKELLEEYPET